MPPSALSVEAKRPSPVRTIQHGAACPSGTGPEIDVSVPLGFMA